MIFDLQNIIISYSNDDEIKLKFYNKYPDKITEINLNSDVRIDLSKFTKLKKLYLPKNTTLQDTSSSKAGRTLLTTPRGASEYKFHFFN